MFFVPGVSKIKETSRFLIFTPAAANAAAGAPNMNKKIVIVSAIVLLIILVGGGFFWWWQIKEIKGSPADYVIKETAEGKIVENKRAGLAVKVPESWNAEKIEIDEGLIIFFFFFSEIEQREMKIVLPVKKGCLLRTVVIYKEANLDQIKKETKIDHLLMGAIKYDEFEEIAINNYPGLKNTFDFEKLGSGVSIYIPIKNKVYSFHLNWAFDEKEKCLQEFDKFLENISIK